MKHHGITQSIKKRLPWLCLLFFLGMLVSSVVGIFESLVSELALVICFQSLVLGMAGNVGTQSLALTIRMITKDSDGKDAKRKYRAAMLRELVTGLAAGIFLAALSFTSVGAYICLLRGESISYAFSVSGCVAAALALSVSVSSLVGAATPLLLQKLGIDPAVASGPLITTVNDLVAVITYYGLAVLWLA